MNAIATFFLHFGEMLFGFIFAFLKAALGLFLLASICYCLNEHPYSFGGLFVGSIFFWRWYL